MQFEAHHLRYRIVQIWFSYAGVKQRKANE